MSQAIVPGQLVSNHSEVASWNLYDVPICRFGGGLWGSPRRCIGHFPRRRLDSALVIARSGRHDGDLDTLILTSTGTLGWVHSFGLVSHAGTIPRPTMESL